MQKAKRIIELNKGNKSILVTVWEGGQVSNCITERDKGRSLCETCAADDAACNEWLDYLRNQDYEVKEIDLADTEVQESLSRFMAERARDLIIPTLGIEPMSSILGEVPEELEPGGE